MMHLFSPYDPQIHGSVEEYLEYRSVDNLFYGVEHFMLLKEKGILVPKISTIRIDYSPAPDRRYVVAPDFYLQGIGGLEYTMSVVGGEQGVHLPERVLKDVDWSAYFLYF